MGLILPVVAYVVGRGPEAEYISTRYNTEKRAFLERYRNELERYLVEIEKTDLKSGGPAKIIMRREYKGPPVVFEEKRSNRQALSGLIGNCTIVITELSDLCRIASKRSAAEGKVYKVLANSLTPVVLASGFKCDGFANDFDEIRSTLNETGKEISEIIHAGVKGVGEDGYIDFACKLVTYTLDINARMRESAKRII